MTTRGAVLGMAEQTKTREQTKPDTKTRVAPPWNVVVWDDPVTLMSYVTTVFQQVFGYSASRAERLMLEVHERGKSVVWTGAREQAEIYVGKLQSFSLKTTLEPGHD